MSENNAMKGVLVAALAFTAGALTALLLAPASGDKTRRRIGRLASDAGEGAVKLAHEARAGAEAVIHDVAGKAREGVDTVRKRVGGVLDRADAVASEVERNTK